GTYASVGLRARRTLRTLTGDGVEARIGARRIGARLGETSARSLGSDAGGTESGVFAASPRATGVTRSGTLNWRRASRARKSATGALMRRVRGTPLGGACSV